MTTYFFPECRLNVSDWGQTTAYFSSGQVLERLPRPVEDQLTARLLGYGSDTLRFRREHDALLHTIALLQGRGCSPMLHKLAHSEEADSDTHDEEDVLCAQMHRWLNLDIWSEVIASAFPTCTNKDELRNFLRAVLEGEITHLDTTQFALAA